REGAIAMNALRDAARVCDEARCLLEISLAYRKQWFAIDLKVGPGRLNATGRQGRSPLESGVIASNDMRALRGGNVLYGRADVGHAKPACDIDFDGSDARTMQTDISRITERQNSEGIVDRLELI